ncbi:hypothetical protein FM996_00315 [Methylosinus sporium]|uniref:Uncharacterized protein n=1 Tax=Methylosinus sporium TaxID=428 RepID=A0A549T9B7_METSR|nr:MULTISPECIES: hypothetical protein [Methylosinus]MBU3888056.1 hypothetical protein [Methylosinus sp. KRF6]TRL38445.1 hypothetical protein FM996_00315 [Methylosinus sporium]
MKFRSIHFFSAFILPCFLPCFLVGCGIRTPDIAEPWDQDIPAGTFGSEQKQKFSATAQIEYEVKKRIFCDLKEAVQAANALTATEGKKTRPLLPNDWGVQVSISLAVDEILALNPGINFNTPIHNGIVNFVGEYIGPATIAGGGLFTGAPAAQTYGPLSLSQSYALGLGGTLSSTASRTDTFNPYWSVGHLMEPNTETSDCRRDPFVAKGATPASSSPFILESDLGIKDWLVGAMITNTTLHSVDVPQSFSVADSKSSAGKSRMKPSGKSSPKKSLGFTKGQVDTVTLELKFLIVSSGNITPTWRLVRVSANIGNLPLFNTGRTRTHDVIITIGPNNETSAWAFNSAQIGRAVGAATRTPIPLQ